MNFQPSAGQGSTAPARAYILAVDEGESLLLGSRRAPLVIKVSPEAGSPHLSAIMEHIAPGDGIPVHLHQSEDEIIFVYAGEGLQRLGETEHTVAAGSLVYIPRGTWHGLRNPATTGDLIIVAIFTPTGMEHYFRAIGTDAGEEYKPLTPEQEGKIEQLHGIRYKPG